MEKTSSALPGEALAFCPDLVREIISVPAPSLYAEGAAASSPPGERLTLYSGGAATSSLDVAHALARHGLLPPWTSVLVQSQSAGRGQMRREWQSPQGNLFAALALPQQGPLATLAAAPAFGGLMAEALNSLGFAVALKWPNDILVRHEGSYLKTGGILLEERGNSLIAGIGLNLVSAPPPQALRKNHAHPAGTLAAHGLTARELWRKLVRTLFFCYGDLQSFQGWWPALAEKHLAYMGCAVQLHDADDQPENVPITGVLAGLSLSGGVLLRRDARTDSFLSGSLLPL